MRRHISKCADTIAAASRDAYRELVYAESDFYDYFRAVTPIDVIERMQIGSRPVHRAETEGLERTAARAVGVRVDADAPHDSGLVRRRRGPHGGDREVRRRRSCARRTRTGSSCAI